MDENKENCTHDCSNCSANCSSRDLRLEPHKLSKVKHIIGVVSGKGGVGKSMVCSLLASAMQKKGHNTAILDADVTGPSIPKMFNLSRGLSATENGFFPKFSNTGIQIMSTNLLLEDDTQPVVWRGPVISGLVSQFWQECIWNDVEYMFVDMPPGTGDIALTVFQSLPVDGIIVVTSPQDLVSMIVQKCVNMAKLLNIPILALVENMSYFICPDCDKKHYIFGESDLEALSNKHDIKYIARLPINPQLAKLADNGQIEEIKIDEMDKLANMIELNLK